MWGRSPQYPQCLAHEDIYMEDTIGLRLVLSWQGADTMCPCPPGSGSPCSPGSRLSGQASGDPMYVEGLHGPNWNSGLGRAPLWTTGASLDGCGASLLDSSISSSGTLSYPTLNLSLHTPVPGQVYSLLFLHSPWTQDALLPWSWATVESLSYLCQSS